MTRRPANLPRRSALIAAALATVAGAAAAQEPARLASEPATTVLADTRAEAAERRLAAERLAAAGDVEAVRRQLEAVGDPAGRLAAARAVAEAPRIDPAWVDPLFALLDRDATPELAAAATAALARAEPAGPVVARLARLADDLRQPQASRRAAVRALGHVPTRRSAEALAGWLSSPDPQLAAEAAAALRELAALGPNDDPADWWAETSALPPAEFDRGLLAQRGRREARQARQRATLDAMLRRSITTIYRNADAAGRAEQLPAMLRSPAAPVRALGAELIYRDMTETGRVPDGAAEALAGALGDAEPAVRLQAARAIGVLNDPATLEPLLARLRAEDATVVRAALVRALAPLRDPRAAGALVDALGDEDEAVATAAAQGLRGMGDLLALADESAVDDARSTLDVVMRDTGRPAATREAAVHARAAIGGPGVGEAMARMLAVRDTPPVGVRRAVLQALAEHGDDRAGDLVAAHFDDPDPQVRRAAVRAAVATSLSFERADALSRRLRPEVEPDAAVREAAWLSMTALMPRAPERQLAAWPDRFAGQPERQLAVLRVLADMAGERGDDATRSARLHQAADALSATGDHAEAARALREAVELLWASESSPAVVLLGRGNALLDAHLAAGEWTEAAAFGGEVIRRSPSFRGDVGSRLRLEADRLVEQGRLEDAAALVEAALAMDPPLEEAFTAQLRETAEQIRQRRGAGSVLPRGRLTRGR